MPTSNTRGSPITVSLVDSVLTPPDELADALAVSAAENYVASHADDTTGHGSDVLECIGYFAPDSRFETYRVLAPDGRATRGNLVAAIADGSSGGQDLLNLSVGLAHDEHGHGDCGGHCRVADETRRAIESGTSVVAATGNRHRADPLGTHCPAILDTVVGVGGFVSHCTSALVETNDCGQYWVRSEDPHGPYCGQRGCSQSASCAANRFEQPWQGNVSFHNAVPAVLAPVHHPAGSADDPVLQSGTSFGAGIVTGILAALLGDLSTTGRTPVPTEVHRAVRNGSTPIDRGPLEKFSAEGTWDELLHG